MHTSGPTDAIPVAHPKFLIIGQPGIGKSTLGYSFNTLLLDFDKGSHRVENRGHTGHPMSWHDLNLTAAQFAPYTGVTIDTVERCLGMITAALLEEGTRWGADGALYPQGHGEAKRRLCAMLDRLASYGLDMLLIAHAKDQRVGDRREIRADMPQGTRDEILKRVDFVGYLALVGTRRMLTFHSSDSFNAKNARATFAPIEIPPADQAQSFMAELFDRAREAMSKPPSAESIRVRAAVASWQAELVKLATADQFNEALLRLRAIKASDAAVHAQVTSHYQQAAKAAGMKYEAATDRMFDTGVRPPAPAAQKSFARAASWQPGLLSEVR